MKWGENKTMTQGELNVILEKHQKWLQGEPGGERANLRGANLQGANLQWVDLQEANLQWANLQGAKLRGADLQRAKLQWANLRGAKLRGADLDYSCWPLWCGSLDAKADQILAAQIAYHFCRLDCDDPEYIKARNAIRDFANKFHRVEE